MKQNSTILKLSALPVAVAPTVTAMAQTQKAADDRPNIVVIVLLRFVLKRREKFREEMKKRDNALAQKTAEEKENGNDSAGN